VPGSVATRQETYAVFDQNGNFISTVEVREILQFLPGGTNICPAGTTLQGNQCIGQWNNPGGYFLDAQSVGIGAATLNYGQYFQYEVVNGDQNDQANGTIGSLNVTNNYVTVGQGVNILYINPSVITLNSNTAGNNPYPGQPCWNR
jgi:hypothetical protein